jgi:hypothetical protein
MYIAHMYVLIVQSMHVCTHIHTFTLTLATPPMMPINRDAIAQQVINRRGKVVDNYDEDTMVILYKATHSMPSHVVLYTLYIVRRYSVGDSLFCPTLAVERISTSLAWRWVCHVYDTAGSETALKRCVGHLSFCMSAWICL